MNTILILKTGKKELLDTIGKSLECKTQEDYKIVYFNAKEKFDIKDDILVNPQIDENQERFGNFKKSGGASFLWFFLKIKYRKLIKQIVAEIKHIEPTSIICDNYFLLAVTIYYKKKFNLSCRIFAFNNEFINSRSWLNKNHIYCVNNETAFFDAIGKKKYSPATVRQVQPLIFPNNIEDEEKSSLKKSLQIKEDEFLIVCDKLCGKTFKIIKSLSNFPFKICFAVLSSNQKKEVKLRKKLQKSEKNNVKMLYIPRDSENLIKNYLCVSDISLCSADYVFFKKALLCASPTLIYGFAGKNNLTRKFAENIGSSVFIRDPEKCVDRISLISSHRYKLDAIKENILKFLNSKFDADAVSSMIIEEMNRPVVKISKNEYVNMLYELAEEEKFDTYTTPININSANPKIDYEKIKKKTIPSRFYGLIIKSIVRFIGPIVDFIGFSIKIRGRKNLRGIKSGITISNHVHYLDCLWNFQALSRKRKVYITGAPYNFKKGFFGATLKAGGFIPIAASFSQKKEFDKLLTDILSNGGIVHFYPEEAMWLKYEQSRPYKRGAFYYASKNNVPIIPIVFLFRKAWLSKKKNVTVQICKPIYPNKNLSTAENCNAMLELAQKEYDETVIEFYGYDKENYSKNKVQKKVKKSKKKAQN